MSAWKDFGKTTVFAAAMAASGSVFGGSFEEGILVTDRAEITVAPVDPENVLPGESILVQPEDVQPEDNLVVGPVSESFAAPESFSVRCDQYGTVGCTSCDDEGCGRSGWLQAAGYLNRLLRPADPRWVGQVDALMLWQGNIASRPLYTDNATGLTALDVNQAQPPMSAGPRFGLFLNLDDCYAIEGNYFNVQAFEGQQTTPLTAGGYDMNNIAGLTFPGIDQAQLMTSGQIQSAELNWRRRQCGLPITWLAGFRWVEWNQRLQVTDVYFAGEDTVNVVTGNDLYGGQAGMDVGLWNSGGRFTVNGIGKAGIFYNTAFQRSSHQDLFSSQQAAAVAEQTSFFGEIGANASVKLTNWLSWRAGYSVFWLSAVATAADQLSNTDLSAVPPTATINTNGSVLLHGVTTGLEARW